MRTAFFSAKPFEKPFFEEARDASGAAHEIVFLEPRLTRDTAILAHGFPAACLFILDAADEPALRALADGGTRFLALRSAGFNNVDLRAAEALGVTVARVPAYSPYAVAEHAVGLMLTLNRKIHRAYNRVREHNFSLDGLMGFDMHGKTVGIVGTGRIGEALARILLGFGCRVLAHDPAPNPACLALGVEYLALHDLLPRCHIVSLQCPLTPDTRHLIDVRALARMRRGSMLINTSRGAVVDTRAVIDALKAGHLGSLGIDVYEEEGDLFFRDLSDQVLHDDVFARLLTFPNVIVTAHQGFFTADAMRNIASTTIENLAGFEAGCVPPANLVSAARLRA